MDTKQECVEYQTEVYWKKNLFRPSPCVEEDTLFVSLVFGDFNYRLDDLDITKIKELVNNEEYEKLTANDQVCL